MKKLVISAAVAAAMLMPSMLLAADDAMMAKPMPMYVCMPAAATAKPNAMMGTAGLTCTKVDGAKMHASVMKVHAMEGTMDAPSRAAVIELERMITSSMSGGVTEGG